MKGIRNNLSLSISTLRCSERHRRAPATALRLLDDGRLAAARFFAPAYDLYRRRIAQFQIADPPANWSGIFTAEEK